MSKITIVKCPTCSIDVKWVPESKFRPFCSERCRLIDLGAWADGKYSVAAEDDPLSQDLLQLN